jgi:hypothetical protein
MYRVLFALFCIIFVVGINGAWLKQLTSIDEDANELAQLAEEFWSLKPAILKRAKPFVYCQIIDQCCNDEDRSEAVSLMGQYIYGSDGYQFAELMLTCMNPTASNKSNKLCLSTVESIVSLRTIYQNPDVKKYISITRNYEKELISIHNYVLSTCNSEEIQAYFCLSNKKLVETCSGKILQKIYDNVYTNYEEFVADTKQALIDINQQLS